MNNEQYLKELREAKEKYMVTDFPKYLTECKKIDEKFNLNFNISTLYPTINKEEKQND
jgi:hypothetical protein